ncbi:uncharacterized protein PADG_12278 [Paracoccidioides brasiliensis Pb18]|uniref:Uncharacterized protein n=1 Tax=Paracoccidioides brasiliensis (strain Pb18) TaxID=502780 RepID=A0A0A0HTF3_PARBD|nr:uncharacterized protein PADG_12278 [Paracoccidioides brasiliensis Pb18]KGM91598.1 hypothetical protein PADG_12278 [Paracoccidioides brasiliensis Pb18]ODH52051.1 hypothetical protein GX48_01840 [Paracoccidioides brasiliensis]
MFRPPAAVGMRYAGLGLTSSRTDAGAEFGNTVEAASKAVEQKRKFIAFRDKTPFPNI